MPSTVLRVLIGPHVTRQKAVIPDTGWFDFKAYP